MKHKRSKIFVLTGTLLIPFIVHADADANRGNTGAFISDSVITAKIKTQLAAEKLSSLTKLNVDTDASGIIWISGSVANKAESDKAISIARGTKGVNEVKSDIRIEPKK